jgi:hypothetical protein
LQTPVAHSAFPAQVAPAADGTYEQNAATVAAGFENAPLAPLHDAPFTVPQTTCTLPTPPLPPVPQPPTPPALPPAPPVAVSVETVRVFA